MQSLLNKSNKEKNRVMNGFMTNMNFSIYGDEGITFICKYLNLMGHFDWKAELQLEEWFDVKSLFYINLEFFILGLKTENTRMLSFF